MRIAVLAVILAPGLLALLPARADEAARHAARATIERQIEAFRRNDPAAAYAEAAPQIRSLFPTPEAFLAMVEQGYAAVLHPRSLRFEAAEESVEGEIAQGVSLQDAAGVDWLALYTLRRQEDGSWRITGCRLQKAPGDSA